MYRWLRHLRRLKGPRYRILTYTAALSSAVVAVSENSKTKQHVVHEDVVLHSKWKELDHEPTRREKRFLEFASVEYDDVIYMTPMDFIDSLLLDAPRGLFFITPAFSVELRKSVKCTIDMQCTEYLCVSQDELIIRKFRKIRQIELYFLPEKSGIECLLTFAKNSAYFYTK